METIERPEFVKDEHLYFLDELREEGVTNMWGAAPYIREEYPEMTKEQASKILFYWMQTFGERHD